MFGGAAFYFSDQQMEKVEDQEAGAYFLSGLLGKINQVSQISLVEKDSSTHLMLKHDRWVVQEKSSFDADFPKVKKLLLGLAEMETIEAKTSKPENYGRLGVQGVGESGDVVSREIQLLDKADNLMYALIIGKIKSSRAPGSKDAIYVRLKGEKKSWLVSGRVNLPKSNVDWLNKSVIDLAPEKIQSVNIRHSDNSQLLISKKDSSDKNFGVENLPLKAELKSDDVANNIANVLQRLTFEDVLPRGKFQADNKQVTKVVFKTFDGLVVVAKLIAKLDGTESKHYLWFDVKLNSDNEKVEKESKELNAKFVLWVYEISESKANQFNKKLEDVIKTS